MSIAITFNGQSYIIPSPGETGWGSNLDSFFVAIPAGCLQKTGGNFTLSAETDFGGSFGLKSLYLKSKTINPSSSGMLRLAKSDNISWRNNLNTLDLPLAVNGLDQLTFNGLVVASGGPGVPADATHDGYLLATDWVIFNGKQDTIAILPVNKGGTGVSTFTPYAVVCAGTTGTGVFQEVSAIGTTGQVLTSNGAGALPTWQAAGGGGSGTVNSGTQYQMTYYATTGTAVSGNSSIKTNASGQLLLSSGTVAIPSLAFSADPDTGLFLNSIDGLGFVANGLHWWTMRVDGPLYGKQAGSRILVQDGTYLAPAYSWANDADTGFYYYNQGIIGLSGQGVLFGTLGWSGDAGVHPQLKLSTLGSATAPLFGSLSSASGIYFANTPSRVMFSAGGTNAMDIAPTYIWSKTAAHYFSDGTQAAPVIAFNSESGTGIYRIGAANLGIACTGTKVIDAAITTGVQTKGTALANSAPTGFKGEYIESVTLQNVGATGLFSDLTSISLTAGDWDVSGLANWVPNGATFTTTDFELGISSTAGNSNTGLTLGSNWVLYSDVVPITFTNFSAAVPVYRISLASTTTFYLKGKISAYSVATPQVSVRLSARRVR